MPYYYDGKHQIKPAEMQEIWQTAKKEKFASLGVAIAAGYVWENKRFAEPRILGPLKQASALVTDGTQAHRIGGPVAASMILGPVGLLGATSTKTKAYAVVILA